MRDAITRFVLDAAISAGQRPLVDPPFRDDPEGWARALEYAERLQASLPVLLSISRAEWYEDAPDALRLAVDERVARERMILALLDEELQRSLTAFAAARIPALILKGMDLGRRYYPERLCRPMTDVDLLVPPDSFWDSLRVLGREGYRVVGPFPTERFRVELARREGGPVVELHKFMLAGDTEESVLKVWERSRDRIFPDLAAPARGLAPEDQLVYLVRHAAVQHCLETPVWLNDLHYLIASEEFSSSIDWGRAVRRLADAGALSAAWLTFGLLGARWGTPIPAEARTALARRLGPLRRRVVTRMAVPERWFPIGGRTLPWVARSRFFLRDRVLDALRYGARREELRIADRREERRFSTGPATE